MAAIAELIGSASRMDARGLFPGVWGTSQGLKEKMVRETLATISLEQFHPFPGHWDLHLPLVQVVSLAWVGLRDLAEKGDPRCGCSLPLC